MKSPPKEWKKRFANNVADKGSMSRIQKSSSSTTDNTILKWAKAINETLLQRRYMNDQ